MAIKPIETAIRRQPGISIIDLYGEIDSFAEDALKEAYADAIDTDPAVIALNFTNVDYINSTGIALIVSLLSKAMKERRRMVTYGLSDHYVEIFNITKLSDYMTIFPDEISAMAQGA